MQALMNSKAIAIYFTKSPDKWSLCLGHPPAFMSWLHSNRASANFDAALQWCYRDPSSLSHSCEVAVAPALDIFSHRVQLSSKRRRHPPTQQKCACTTTTTAACPPPPAALPPCPPSQLLPAAAAVICSNKTTNTTTATAAVAAPAAAAAAAVLLARNVEHLTDPLC